MTLKLFREMVKTGLVGNANTVVSVLSACCKSARLKEGRSVHGVLVKKEDQFIRKLLINQKRIEKVTL